MALIVMTSATFGGGFSTPAKGPLNFTGQTPLQTMRLDILPTHYDILDRGHIELTLFNTVTNRWNISDEFLIDLELLQNIVGMSVGVGGGSEIGITVPVLTRTGGHLDQFIYNFHSLFGLSQAGRDIYPHNSIEAKYYIDETGEWVVILDENDAGTVLGDVSVFWRSEVFRSRSWLRSLIVTALFRFPTSTDRNYYGSAGTDAAVSLSSSHKLSSLYLYTTLGYGMFGSSGETRGIDLRSYQWTLFVAVEWPVSKNVSLVIQEMANSGMAKEYYDFHRTTHELVIGVKQYISSRLMIEYGMTENLFNYESSNDFGLSFGLTYRL
jgi:hypothetical protein